jgi:hypothetical protein
MHDDEAQKRQQMLDRYLRRQKELAEDMQEVVETASYDYEGYILRAHTERGGETWFHITNPGGVTRQPDLHIRYQARAVDIFFHCTLAGDAKEAAEAVAALQTAVEAKAHFEHIMALF